jgi:hypothetical protein
MDEREPARVVGLYVDLYGAPTEDEAAAVAAEIAKIPGVWAVKADYWQRVFFQRKD